MLRVPVGFLAALAAVMISGCSGASSAPTAAPPQHTFSASPCPTPPKSPPAKWPKNVPADLPKPPGAQELQVQPSTSDGVHIIKFTTPSSLRDGVLFVVDKLPKAGYLLGRGDAEANEADAPFANTSTNTRGLYRLFATESCKTLWLLATVNTQAQTGGGSPLLPPHSPSGSPSPLPFG